MKIICFHGLAIRRRCFFYQLVNMKAGDQIPILLLLRRGLDVNEMGDNHLGDSRVVLWQAIDYRLSTPLQNKIIDQ